MAGRRPIRRERRRALYVGAAIAVLVALWGLGLKSFAASIPDDPAMDEIRTDAIVVLTGGSGRLDEGLGLLLADRADILFVSGVYDGLDVRYLLQTFLEGGARIEHRVEIGNATNTVGNAEETAEWMRGKGYTSLRLVTAAYHMHPVFPDHVMADWWRWPGSAALVIKEYNKFLLAGLRQRAAVLRGVFPADG